MTIARRERHVLRRLAETLLVGAVGGAAFASVGLPAAWLSGSMLAVSIWALARRPVLVPDPLAKVVFVVIGISLGAGVTPETIARMNAWPLSLLMLSVTMAAITLAVTLYLRYVHGWDVLSALFAGSPGALVQALAFAAETKSDFKSVAMVQSVRLILLTVVLPVGLAAFAATGAPPLTPSKGLLAQSLGELSLLLVVCAFAAILGQRLHVPGGLVVGPMIASGVLHGAGIVHVNLPMPISIASLVIMGSAIGARFAGTERELLYRLLAAALGALAVGTIVALGFAFAVAHFLSLRTGDLILAYAPGGLEAMTILSFALNLDPAFVAAHQLWRFVFVSLTMPVAMRLLMRRNRPAADPRKDE